MTSVGQRNLNTLGQCEETPPSPKSQSRNGGFHVKSIENLNRLVDGRGKLRVFWSRQQGPCCALPVWFPLFFKKEGSARQRAKAVTLQTTNAGWKFLAVCSTSQSETYTPRILSISWRLRHHSTSRLGLHWWMRIVVTLRRRCCVSSFEILQFSSIIYWW